MFKSLVHPLSHDPTTRQRLQSLSWLLAGSALAHFSGWEPNLLVATWLFPVFLLLFSRRVPWVPALVLPLVGLTLSGWLTVRGAWHMGASTEVFFSVVMALPVVAGLAVDRLLHPRLGPLTGSLAFPSTWVCMDWIYSHLYGLGDVFSPALTQFHLAPVRQLAALTGIYGITFLIGWFASVAASVWSAPAEQRWGPQLSAWLAVFAAVMFYGSARLTWFDHDAPTVRVATVVVPHDSDYHAEIIDRNSPRSEASRWLPELSRLQDEVFEATRRAAEAGARVVMWSETAVVVYEDHEQAFLERAAEVARAHGIYLVTTALVARYDDPMIENQLTLFDPQGEVAYTYLKTQTWYPTESDGVIHSVDTPYGRIAAAICFDIDNPAWMQQVAASGAEILLVPSFDTRAISPYHTEVGLFRAIEGGYSVVRAVNDGTSMAVDDRGRVLGLQDSFRTQERTMFVDVPARREQTLYATLGDWFPLLALLLGLGLVGLAYRSRSASDDGRRASTE